MLRPCLRSAALNQLERPEIVLEILSRAAERQFQFPRIEGETARMADCKESEYWKGRIPEFPGAT
jgi:hypothetical protein